MTAKETLEIITNAIQSNKNMTAEQDMALAIAQKAIEKQIPKEPIQNRKEHIRYTSVYSCPSCGRGFAGTGIADYCYHCGQMLDWSGGNDV